MYTFMHVGQKANTVERRGVGGKMSVLKVEPYFVTKPVLAESLC
jgi:hypothetical protein